MSLADVADVLSTSVSQMYALVRRGDLRGIRIGGRGQWRVEDVELERYIEARYDEADEYRRAHPFVEGGRVEPDDVSVD